MNEPVITERKIRELLLRVYLRNYAMPETWVDINEAAGGARLYVNQAKHGLRILENRKMAELKATDGDGWQVRLTSAGIEEAMRLQKPFLIRWISDKETRKTVVNMTLGAIISGIVGYLFHLLGK
jgi:hypothetical protein